MTRTLGEAAENALDVLKWAPGELRTHSDPRDGDNRAVALRGTADKLRTALASSPTEEQVAALVEALTELLAHNDDHDMGWSMPPATITDKARAALAPFKEAGR